MVVVATIYERPDCPLTLPPIGEDQTTLTPVKPVMFQEMCAAVRRHNPDATLQYVHVNRSPAATWFSTDASIWVKRSLIRVSQSLGDATASATHSVSARLTQLLPVVMETLKTP